MKFSQSMEKDVLTSEHPLWDEFVDRMHEREICDYTLRSTEAILTDMAQAAPIHVKGTLEVFKAKGGHCDCEVYLNLCLR